VLIMDLSPDFSGFKSLINNNKKENMKKMEIGQSVNMRSLGMFCIATNGGSYLPVTLLETFSQRIVGHTIRVENDVKIIHVAPGRFPVILEVRDDQGHRLAISLLKKEGAILVGEGLQLGGQELSEDELKDWPEVEPQVVRTLVGMVCG
jgi:hypothetical protein